MAVKVSRSVKSERIWRFFVFYGFNRGSACLRGKRSIYALAQERERKHCTCQIWVTMIKVRTLLKTQSMKQLKKSKIKLLTADIIKSCSEELVCAGLRKSGPEAKSSIIQQNTSSRGRLSTGGVLLSSFVKKKFEQKMNNILWMVTERCRACYT